ncbi:hypothetical protein GGU10DRAFT_415823 [Lentinula aff. detonsa]|uniref:TEA domain-containing protein n=1 Tax=Lentinula aff. detonsa TaxID=2804958 RepID=A0AA38KDB1_9AGAR|nr:hypothetical protein GGU10DRAFT_415823 [Lentinula aff. detonsa]
MTVEQIFVDDLRAYTASTISQSHAVRLISDAAVDCRSRLRNAYLVQYLAQYGIERNRKQVASHLQVLKNMWKAEGNYSTKLVAEMIEILQLVIPVMDRLLAIFKPSIKACKETADSSQVLETQSSGPTPVPIQISTATWKEEPLIAIERRVVAKRSKLQPDTGEQPRKKRKEVKKNEIDVIFGS